MRTIARRHQPTEPHRWAQKTPSAEPGALRGVRCLEVVSALTARWGSLDARVRRPVECLFETELKLRRKPFAILKYLAMHPRRLVTQEELVEAVWGKVAMVS
jgi:DNA-binding response OmpR family regulator